MRDALSCWEELAFELSAHSRLLVLLDYDGTLTPIAPRPEDAVLANDVRELLEKLAEKPTITLGIVSGRSLAAIRKIVGVEGVYYAGNHGLEAVGQGFSYVNPKATSCKKEVPTVRAALEEALKGIEGVVVEDKGLGVVVHYRMVAQTDVARVKERFQKATGPFVEGSPFRIAENKKTLECVPDADADKGSVVRAIAADVAERTGETPGLFYAGDDATDEDAFRAIGDGGVTVAVGKGESAARYRVDDTAGVHRLLERILDTLS